MIGMEECLDRISVLPEGILHQVLSFLPTKYTIRTAATCKRMNEVWTTLPYLDLGPNFFPPVLPPQIANIMEAEEDDPRDDSMEVDHHTDDGETKDEEGSGDHVVEESDVLEQESDHAVEESDVLEVESNDSLVEGDKEDIVRSQDREDEFVYSESELDSESNEEDYKGNVDKREKLFTFLEQTLSRLKMHDLVLHKFRLVTTEIDDEIRPYLNKWIDYLVHCNIKEFELRFTEVERHCQWYEVPSILFAKSLCALALQNCKIPCVPIITLPLLRKLYLNFVYLDGQIFNDIINACCNLEYLDIYLCPGLSKLEVSALSRLRILNFTPLHVTDEETLVEAHSLEKLTYGGGALKINIIINFEGYLKTLHLCGSKFTNIWFCELISRLPCLEELRLSQLHLKSIEISSSSLKRLIISRVFFRYCLDDGMGEITVHAPNLVFLKYVGPFSYTFPSSLAVKEVVLAIDDLISMHRNEEKCRKVMQFLSVFDYSEVLKLECTFFEHMIIPVEWRSDLLEPLAHIKHLILQGRFQTYPLCSMKKFIESLLWISPNMVSLSLTETPFLSSTGRLFAIDLSMKVPVSDCSTIGRVLRDCILNGKMELECGDPEVWNFLKSCFTSDV